MSADARREIKVIRGLINEIRVLQQCQPSSGLKKENMKKEEEVKKKKNPRLINETY